MKLSRSVKSISYLKQHTADAVREVRESNGPLVITQNGEAKAVLMGVVEYEQAQESFATATKDAGQMAPKLRARMNVGQRLV